ncbi:MAG: hypothetical protein WCO56_18120 [Verrucomicrobiota bacterium]
MSTPRIQVCFALREESIPFAKLSTGNPAVSISIVGVGQFNATNAIERILSQKSFLPAMVLTCGYAGGLSPALKHAAVVYDADPVFPLTPRCAAQGCVRVQFHCDTRIVSTAEEKRQVRATTGADAVEMESAPIRRACQRAGIPSATIRVISDTATEDLPLDFNRIMSPKGLFSPWRLAGELLRHPGAVPELLALRKRNAQAAEQLGRALAAIVSGW